MSRHTLMKPITKAEYRKLLNEQDAQFRATSSARVTTLHRNGRYQQRSRYYGDYLWHQDREKFEVDYAEYIKGKAEGETL